MRTHALECPTFVIPAHLASGSTAMPRKVIGRSGSAWPLRREAEGEFRSDAAPTLPSRFSRANADRVRDRLDENALPSSFSLADISSSIGPSRAHGTRNTEPARFPLPRMERSGP